MVWSYVAGFTFPLGAAALLVGRWRRRMLGGPQTASAKLPAPVHRNSRRVSYIAAAMVTTVSATEQARVNQAKHLFKATTGEIFFWNFATLAVLIAIVQLVEWRKGRSNHV
jgi:hypothetical protein